MSDNKIKRIPTQIYIGAFQGEEKAREIEKLVTDQEFDSHQVICTNMAVASRDIAGKTKIRELGNPKAMEMAVSTAMLGGLLGSMSRLMIGESAEVKAAWELATAAAKGEDQKASRPTSVLAKAATKKIKGMDKERLDKLGKALKPGTSAIVLMFDEVLVTGSDYETKMKHHKQESDSLTEIVTHKIEKYLDQGKDIAFHILMDTDGSIQATRIIEGSDAVQVRDIVVGHDSFAMNQATATASGKLQTDRIEVTPDRAMEARTLLTSSLVAYEVAVDDANEGFVYDKGAVHVSEDKIAAEYEKAKITNSFVGWEKEEMSLETKVVDSE